MKGVEILTPRFFNEFAIRLPKSAVDVVDTLAGNGVIAGVPYARLDHDAGLDDVLIVCATETTLPEDIAIFAHSLDRVIHA